ncbi:MAG: nucleotidyl transferase AbiEii/AbiGii toxin family protein [Saprospiraceae bacterium]|nr:nucleotidyl transferase AbiEii/AbiGii toxin family protein [Saprospiraceae bacterium]
MAQILLWKTNLLFGIFCFIGDVKVDIVRYPHSMIRPIQEVDGIRMYAPEEIIAMKVQAILGRGKRKTFGTSLNYFNTIL